MSDFITDFTDLTRRVELGEIGSSNLVEMVLIEREKNTTLVLAIKEWQVLYNAETVYKRATTDPVRSTEEEMRELILWLAIPWADNDPLFPESDGWTPRALEANVRMRATWQRVVRSTQSSIDSLGAVPTEKGVANGNESIS